MKKTLLFLTVFTLSIAAVSQTTFVESGIYYEVLNATDVEVVRPTVGSYSGSITIPAMVTNSSTNIVYNVTAIGENAFSGYRVTAVNIPSSVTTIKNSAFGYTDITSINIPNSVTSIGEAAFDNCRSLTSITFPNALTAIEPRTFSECTALTSINIPSTVTTIGLAAFDGAGLTSITVPNTVTTIGASAFSHCGSLTAITLPNSITTLEERLFSDCMNLSSVTIPNAVTTIKRFAFRNCQSLASINIPNSVTTIEGSAFIEAGLTSINIPNSITSIGGEAFERCESLATISIPESVTSIGNYAFINCTALTTVNVAHKTPLVIDADIFTNVDLSLATLNVPTDSKTAYEAAAVWQDFGTINATLSLSQKALAGITISYIPNQQILHIDLPTGQAGSNGISAQEVYFYDVLGRGVFAKTLGAKNTIDVSSLQTGVYVVKVGGVAKKFVKW